MFFSVIQTQYERSALVYNYSQYFCLCLEKWASIRKQNEFICD